MNPRIEKLKYETIEISDPDPQLQSLLPSQKREKVSFYLKGANYGIANGIRRTICGELEVKYLTCEISDITTDEPFIKLNELIDRINYIPLNQNISEETTFSINILNNDPKKRYFTVHSRDIKMHKNSTGIKPFPETIRIAELNPGKFLVIPKIRIVKSYGYNIAAACITLTHEYELIDFIPITFINERANFISKRVKVEELVNLFKKFKIKIPEPDELFRKKILVIPNKIYQKQLTSGQIKSIDKYDLVLENPEGYPVNDLCPDDKFLKGYQSTEITGRDFYLSFTLFGNLEIGKLLPLCFNNLIDRLKKIGEELKNPKSGWMEVIQDNIKTQVIIRGEDHTIGNLLGRMVFELDPGIGLVNTPMEHPLSRVIILNIKHSQGLKILETGIIKLIEIFQKFQTDISVK